jgi:single-strand DNA-binding protein
MNDFNKLTLAGRIARDPELYKNPKGEYVCNFTVVSKREWRDHATGAYRQEVSFFDASAWGKTGVAIHTHMKKGDALLIDGFIRQETWTDRDTSEPRSKVTVTVTAYQNLMRFHSDSVDSLASANENDRACAGRTAAVLG